METSEEEQQVAYTFSQLWLTSQTLEELDLWVHSPPSPRLWGSLSCPTPLALYQAAYFHAKFYTHQIKLHLNGWYEKSKKFNRRESSVLYSSSKKLSWPKSDGRNPLMEACEMLLQKKSSKRKAFKISLTICEKEWEFSMEKRPHSYIFTTWSRVGEHLMPDQKQGSESRLFQLEKTCNGSSNTPNLKAVRADTEQNQERKFSIRGNPSELYNFGTLVQLLKIFRCFFLFPQKNCRVKPKPSSNFTKR